MLEEMFQILDHEGNLNESLRPSVISDATLKDFYEKMLFHRMADNKILLLQRQGRAGTYASIKGQEASQVGPMHALRKQDWLVPSFRELSAMLMRGVPLKSVYLYWMGNEWGSHVPADVRVLPVSIPVGSQILHAVGLSRAAQILKKDEISVVYFGDGGTSEGDFHEGCNYAGVFKTPTIFICQNNQWAISVPRKMQTASKTIAQKADAYGFFGIQVDGNDVIAMYQATKDAVERAKSGKGPTLIEAVTFRLADHTTADDAKRYRDEKETAFWTARDPMIRMEKYLAKKNLWDEKYRQALEERFSAEIEKAVEEAENTVSKTDDMFDYLYETMPAHLTEQKKLWQS